MLVDLVNKHLRLVYRIFRLFFFDVFLVARLAFLNDVVGDLDHSILQTLGLDAILVRLLVNDVYVQVDSRDLLNDNLDKPWRKRNFWNFNSFGWK